MNNILLSKCLVIIHVLIHWIPKIIRLLYINNTKYDIYLLLFMLLIKIHWFFLKDECILSYIEKKLVLDNYKLGDDIYCIPIDYFFNINYIYKKESIFDNPIINTIFNSIFSLYILYKNINSTNFILIFIIVLLLIIVTWYWNNKRYKYETYLRQKYKNIDIEKINLSQMKLW